MAAYWALDLFLLLVPYVVVYRPYGLRVARRARGLFLLLGGYVDVEEIVVGCFHWVGFAGGGHAKFNSVHAVPAFNGDFIC